MSIARTLRNDRETMGEHPMYRPSRGHGQAQPQSHQAGAAPRLRRSEDPLAELARLIGQEDPFKEFDAVQPRRAPVNGNGASHHAPAVAPERRPDRHTNGNGGGYANGAVQAPRPLPSRYAQPAAVPARAPAARVEERRPAQPTRTPAPQPQQARTNGASRGYEEQAAPRQNGRDANGYYPGLAPSTREAYADGEVRPARAPATPEPRSRRPEPQPAGRYVPEEAPRHARSRPQPAYQDEYQRGYDNDYDPQYDDEAYLDQADDVYEDVPRQGRGIGFWIVAAIVVASLIAVAFLGVFAYRTVFNSQPRAAVVTKSNAPTKVEPQQQKNAPQSVVSPSNKPIQDRVSGAADQNPTQIMRREETPADLTQQNPQVPQAAPELQQRPAPTKTNPAFTPPQQQQAPQAQPEQQPKRVKTIPLRSDGVPQNAAPQPQNTGPMQLQANPPAQEPDTQAIPPQNRANPNTNSNVPPANRTTVASLGPTPQANTSGNYIVQVASHKTPEEAQTAWSNLRQQYSSIFAGRNADIRKVDLGDRGTFYRAMVGPMSRDQANALCQNLKTQGAGCIVQTRN